MSKDIQLISEVYEKILNEGVSQFSSEKFMGCMETVEPLYRNGDSITGGKLVGAYLSRYELDDNSKAQAEKIINSISSSSISPLEKKDLIKRLSW